MDVGYDKILTLESKSEIFVSWYVLCVLIIVIICTILIFLKMAVDECRYVLWICVLFLLLFPVRDEGNLLAILLYITGTNIICFVSIIFSRQLYKEKYTGSYVAACIWVVVSITVTFGNYYLHQGMVNSTDFIILDSNRQDYFLSDYYYVMYDTCLFYLSLFKYSLRYYFIYSLETIPQIQYYYGIFLSGTIIATLCERMKHKIDG